MALGGAKHGGELMKRYWLFVGEEHQERGGLADFKASFDDHDEAKAAARQIVADGQYVWAEVGDMQEQSTLLYTQDYQRNGTIHVHGPMAFGIRDFSKEEILQ